MLGLLGVKVVPYLEILVTAVLSAALGLVLLSAIRLRRNGGRAGLADGGDAVVFLFDGEMLMDASPAARALLAHSPLATGGAWVRLLAWIAPRFPGAAERIGTLAATGRVVLPQAGAEGASLFLAADLRGGLTRIEISGAAGAVVRPTDPVTDRAASDELELLRAVATAAPTPIWQTDASGEVAWANAAYLALVAAGFAPGQDFVWPLPRLFGPDATPDGQRQQLPGAEGGPGRWFDVQSVPAGAAAPQGRLHFALPADKAVQAETALKAFMQTLARTFAHLPTGLAIFDQDRRLALYNPALVDLTGLPPDFLSARPTLTAVLDVMRERSMLPEPRDYRLWRRRIAELETAAAQGHYEETWSLPGGQTYRVTGRPHPNGALALMLDDISTEIGQTRRYRADLELGQAVIDAMDEAIAVFSASGMLVLSNAAYAALWGHDPGGTLDAEATVAALADHWRSRSAPGPVWDRAEAFATDLGPRRGWTDEARLSDGRLLAVRFERLAGGATLAGFRVTGAATGSPAVFSSVRRSA